MQESGGRGAASTTLTAECVAYAEVAVQARFTGRGDGGVAQTITHPDDAFQSCIQRRGFLEPPWERLEIRWGQAGLVDTIVR